MSIRLLVIIGILAGAGYYYFQYMGVKPDELLAEAHITKDRSGKNLELRFAVPIRFLGHFPESTGDVLQIQFRGIGISGYNKNYSLIDKLIDAGLAKEGMIQDVRFEGAVAGGPFIVVRFVQPVNFKITEVDGLKGLIVTYEAA